MGLQGHRITRPTCSLNLHSPTSYVRGCNSLSVKSKQRRGNLVDYACDITSNLTDIPSEQDDWFVVTHPGCNNPWKCVGCRDIFPTNSAFLKYLSTVHQIRHIMLKCDCDFTSENSHSVGVHKPHCTVILPEEHGRTYKCQRCKFSTNFENGLSVHISRAHPSFYNDQLKERT